MRKEIENEKREKETQEGDTLKCTEKQDKTLKKNVKEERPKKTDRERGVAQYVNLPEERTQFASGDAIAYAAPNKLTHKKFPNVVESSFHRLSFCIPAFKKNLGRRKQIGVLHLCPSH
ncbi:hypothetical protein FQR65_LT00614 [Abscondita terminalis]|nr:hypothetical protein FQR65_LT00614 [Abscondita terminalis]